MPPRFAGAPASTIVPRTSPNYIDPPALTWIAPYSITLTAFATVLVLMRFWVRTRGVWGGLGLDDALLLPAWLLSIAFTTVAIWGTRTGLLGRHTWDVPPSKLEFEALVWESACSTKHDIR